MSYVRVELENGAKAFEPGEDVRGSVSWSLDGAPESMEVRLFWRTEGKGTSDVEVAAVETLDGSGSQGQRSFALRLPDRPWSFSGKLISLVWAVEAVAQPSGEAGRADIVAGPGGRETLLTGMPDGGGEAGGTGRPGGDH